MLKLFPSQSHQRNIMPGVFLCVRQTDIFQGWPRGKDDEVRVNVTRAGHWWRPGYGCYLQTDPAITDDSSHAQHEWAAVAYEERSGSVVWVFSTDEDLNHMKSTCSLLPRGPWFVFSSCFLTRLPGIHKGDVVLCSQALKIPNHRLVLRESWWIYFPPCII